MIDERPRDRVKFEVISRNYAAAGGGKCPYIFFGVRSYRLKRWYTAARQSGRTLLWIVIGTGRFVWRFYCFPLLICAGLVIATWRHEAGVISTQIYLLCELLAIGCLGILVEAHWALRETGDWVSWYHRDCRAATAAFATEQMVDTNPEYVEAKLADSGTNADHLYGVGLLIILPCLVTTYFCLAATSSGSTGPDALLRAAQTAVDAAGGNFPDAGTGLPAMVTITWMVVAAFGVLVVLASSLAPPAMPPTH